MDDQELAGMPPGAPVDTLVNLLNQAPADKPLVLMTNMPAVVVHPDQGFATLHGDFMPEHLHAIANWLDARVKRIVTN